MGPIAVPPPPRGEDPSGDVDAVDVGDELLVALPPRTEVDGVGEVDGVAPGTIGGTLPDWAATASAAVLVYAARVPSPLAGVIGRYPGGSWPVAVPGLCPSAAANFRNCA